MKGRCHSAGMVAALFALGFLYLCAVAGAGMLGAMLALWLVGAWL